MKLHRSDIIASIETCESMEQSEVWIIISCGSENRFYLQFDMPCGTCRTAGNSETAEKFSTFKINRRDMKLRSIFNKFDRNIVKFELSKYIFNIFFD